jgi:hypothetical protein
MRIRNRQLIIKNIVVGGVAGQKENGRRKPKFLMEEKVEW